MTDYDKYRADMMKEAEEFQDFLTVALLGHGINLNNFSSKEYQYTVGENACGAEIKKDRKFRGSGNLYIEYAEKSNPDVLSYSVSGIFREDNSRWFIIGDEKRVWIFKTEELRRIYERNRKDEKPKYRIIENPTSIGFLLTCISADKFASRIITFTMTIEEYKERIRNTPAYFITPQDQTVQEWQNDYNKKPIRRS